MTVRQRKAPFTPISHSVSSPLCRGSIFDEKLGATRLRQQPSNAAHPLGTFNTEEIMANS